MKKALLLVVVLVLVFAFAAPAFAAPMGSPLQVRLTVLPSIKASVSGPNGAGFLSLGSLGIGGKPSGSANLQVASNCAFIATAAMGDLTSGAMTIPAADFDVSDPGSHAAAGNGLSIPIDVAYKTTLPFTVGAGDYTGNLTVTVTAN